MEAQVVETECIPSFVQKNRVQSMNGEGGNIGVQKNSLRKNNPPSKMLRRMKKDRKTVKTNDNFSL